VLNEEQTAINREALRQARRAGVTNLPNDVVPIYEWVTRPEMQFSVFDFVNQQVSLTTTTGQTSLIDLNLTQDPLSSLLDSQLNYAEILYDLTGPSLAELPRFGTERQLMIAIGDTAYDATMTANGSVRFTYPGLYNQLLSQISAGDILSIRLFQVGDSYNTLWEYVLGSLNVISSSNPGSQAAEG